MKQNLIAVVLALIATSINAQYKNVINYPGGRIAISHDGNNYDKDDYVAAAMNLALLEGTGLKSKLVHFDHSNHLKNKDSQYMEMLESVTKGVRHFNIDSTKIFDVQTQLDAAIANFKKEAEKSTENNPLWFCIGGPMEVPWQYINAVDPEKRKFITCISHSSWFNEDHVSPPEMTHTWEDIKALGVKTIRIKNQNKTEWNTKKENVFWMRDSKNPKLQWLYNRNAKKTFDSSDSGMLWWVVTGAENGGNENAGWQDYKPILDAISDNEKRGLPENLTTEEKGFKTIFNGKNLDGWYLKIRSRDLELAKKVFTVENEMIHVFGDSFPKEYNLNTGANDTHGLIYSEKAYSKYILRFEYKWGDRIANNFDKWQYDAGVYYHVINDKVWPTGIEYQIRYDHTTSRNHTGDLIRPSGADYDWFCNEEEIYLHPNDGGKLYTKKHWLHFASPTENFNALNNKWNQCEIIVMGDQYAIHKLNGEIVNMAFNLEPGAGIFGFQSETAEIFYRNIRIKEFDEIIPAEKFLKE
ncbi:3-keto-disaccharide hydrolase [Flagellimonas eckloniae]|uniref:3-keto-alpha-glucoside-1,2-lyase/3-keto-2-hydroxy-glucal hydratase domain-containing protein n=1 Tax=Flagellimonas eckloniae TaxID=346185 RepID=A0A0N8WFH2_9FLAO|nr:DUF1080 domain-containing protein [Allomuricauda eckloniae]KQC28691.1 hypothetical protein AAY42_01350 [Allomuricauda eckloniae]